jgi:superfamily II DNA or RNA helicase
MDIDNQYQQLVKIFKSMPPAAQNQFMRDTVKSHEKDKSTSANSRYLSEDGIIEFVKTKLGAKKVYPYQERILRAFVRYKRVAVRSPHGAGKTALAAWVVLWLMSVYDDVKIPT